MVCTAGAPPSTDIPVASVPGHRDCDVVGEARADGAQGRTRRRPARRPGCRWGNRRVAAGSLGERRSSLPPGQGVSACPPAAAGSNRSLMRGVRGPGCARGRELQRLPLSGGEPLAGPRIVAELRAQLAVDVGMVRRVASGSGDAFACGDPDTLVHRGGHDDHVWFTLFGTAAPGPVGMIFDVRGCVADGERCWQ